MDNDEIGRRIKSLRVGAGMTQEVLADKLEMDYSTISLLECGRRNLKTSTLFDMAVLFNVTSDYMIGLDDKQ